MPLLKGLFIVIAAICAGFGMHFLLNEVYLPAIAFGVFAILFLFVPISARGDNKHE